MNLEKAIITNIVTNEEIPVMFNPEEYTVNKDINYAQQSVPGLSAPIIQFVNGNMQTLEMELFLDTYEDNRISSRSINKSGDDVRNLTRKITDLMNIDASTHAPPVLIFTWASLSFTCVLARASQRFIMFMPDGTPVRARLQVTFNEFSNIDLEARGIKRETADYTKSYEVAQGETLSSIAGVVYHSPNLWRPIALSNHIDSPRVLPAGLHLRIPHLPFRDPQTGEIYQ
jgi:nucleoid-associated protein YgaU